MEAQTPSSSFSPLFNNYKSIFRSDLFLGKVAIVTGGGTGIGKQIALELLELSCTVVIASRKVEKLKLAVAELQSSSVPLGNISYVQCDIKKEEDIKNLMSTVLKRHNRIDFLINNSGGQFPSSAGRIRTKGWESVISLNLNGTFVCCREAFNQWMRNNGGSIVNIVADVWKGKIVPPHNI
jgi:peroxisomal trans-2-enoyl-CoA reductase